MREWEDRLGNYTISTTLKADSAVFSPVRDALKTSQAFSTAELREILLDGPRLRDKLKGKPIRWQRSPGELAENLIDRSGLSRQEIAQHFPKQDGDVARMPHGCPFTLLMKFTELFAMTLVHAGLIACCGRLGERWLLLNGQEFEVYEKAFHGRDPEEVDPPVPPRPWARLGPIPVRDSIACFEALAFVVIADLRDLVQDLSPGPRSQNDRRREKAAIGALERLHAEYPDRPPVRQDVIDALAAVGYSKAAAGRCWDSAKVPDWRKGGRRGKSRLPLEIIQGEIEKHVNSER